MYACSVTWIRERMFAKCVSIAPPCGKFWFILFMSLLKQLKALASDRRAEMGSKSEKPSVPFFWRSLKMHRMSENRRINVLTHHHPGRRAAEPAGHTSPARIPRRGASRCSCKYTTKAAEAKPASLCSSSLTHTFSRFRSSFTLLPTLETSPSK